jgi:hypothetical protein
MVKKIKEKKDFDEDFEGDSSKEKLITNNLVIVNNQPRAIYLPPTTDKGVGQALVPGENSVSKKDWEAVIDNPTIKRFLEFRFLVNKGFGEARPLLETLDGVTQDEARVFIKKEKSKKQLETWVRNTKSEYLKKACEERIKRI